MASVKKCVVIGNGPSLRGFDLSTLTVDTIGMNAAYRHWERIGWYPTHYACLDDVVVRSHHEQIAKLIEEGLCESAILANQFLQDHPKAIEDRRYFFTEMFSWPKDPLTTGSHAVRYAISRGYTDIALIGIDLRYTERIPESRITDGILDIVDTPKRNPNYFFDDYQQKGDRYNVPNSNGNVHLKSFVALGKDLTGARVVNSNRESEIAQKEIFPFQPLDDFLD